MQTNSLPLQLPVAGAQPQSPRTNVSMPNDGVNFGATLMRQIDQRQIEQRQLEGRQALAQPRPQIQPNQPPPAAAPKPQAGPKPAANETRAPVREVVREATRDATREPAREGAHTAESSNQAEATAQAGTGKTAEGEDSTEAASEGAKAADAVVDMLALMASFNTMQAAPAAPSVLETAAAQSGALLAGLKGKAGDAAEPLVQLDNDGGAAGRPKAEFGANADANAGAGANAEVDLRALELGKTSDTAKLPLEAGDFAAKLRDSAALAAAAREPLPSVETLTGMNTQASALQNAQAAGTLPGDRLSARVGTPAWDNQVGQKVIWMVGGEDQSATLELNPPDLGPLQVVLNVSNDMASVTFSSQQLEVRQALENALPRLREMMSESGIALGNASVNAGSEGRQGQDGQGSGRPGSGRGDGSGDGAVAEVMPRQRTGTLGGAGAVDIFA